MKSLFHSNHSFSKIQNVLQQLNQTNHMFINFKKYEAMNKLIYTIEDKNEFIVYLKNSIGLNVNENDLSVSTENGFVTIYIEKANVDNSFVFLENALYYLNKHSISPNVNKILFDEEYVNRFIKIEFINNNFFVTDSNQGEDYALNHDDILSLQDFINLYINFVIDAECQKISNTIESLNQYYINDDFYNDLDQEENILFDEDLNLICFQKSNIQIDLSK